MNDRLEIASRLLAIYSDSRNVNFFNVLLKEGETHHNLALRQADKLIALEKETRPKEAPQEGEPYNTAAGHVNKSQYVDVNGIFKEVVNVDNEFTHQRGKLIWIYFNDNTSEMYSYNEEVTVKDKI